MNTSYSMTNYTQRDAEIIHDDDEEQVALPGFRFHPTDEELIGYYLRRKVNKKAIRIELIKQIDIYKFDPWDLPKPNNTIGEKEGYFFCKRGRKYRNSIRPNRVTGSGFWKATGIDKPVHSNDGGDCIGLKKTLVYYRGSAGKGTKTDWMMHEFRLPENAHNYANNNANAKSSLQEAEVWTLCRIFKRNLTHRKYTADWRELSTKRNPNNRSSKTSATSNGRECYVSFGAPLPFQQDHDQKSSDIVAHDIIRTTERSSTTNQWSSTITAAHQAPPYMASSSTNNIRNNNYNIPCENNNTDLFSYGEVDVDEIISVMEFACGQYP